MKQCNLNGFLKTKSIFLIILVMMATILVPATVSAEGDNSLDTAFVSPNCITYTPNISTMLSCGNYGENPVFVGDSVTDQVIFSWDAPEGTVPTGDIEIWRRSPDAADWELIETRSLEGIAPVTLEGTTAKQYVFTTNAVNLTSPGEYYFKAVYNPLGDPFFNSSVSSSFEKALVIKRTPSISTLLSCGNNGENPVLVGDSITDQITFSWDAPEGVVPAGVIQIWRLSPGSSKWEWIEGRELEGITASPYIFTSKPSQLTTLGDYYFKADYVPINCPEFAYCNSEYFAEKANVYTLLRITKTVNDQPFSGPAVSFEIRKGAAAADGQFGNVLEQKSADVSNNGSVDFDTKLYPGVYQLCEYVPQGYVPSYILGTYGIDWFKPGYAPTSGSPLENTLIAVNFTVNQDGSITFPDQTIQPGSRFVINNQVSQMPLTIGFWKNHCSVSGSNGGQDPLLDRMLYTATQAGRTIKIGDLSLPGSSNKDNAGESAVKAYRLLDKSRIDDGRKMASDPAFNLAAQLLAYKLNLVNCAWSNNVAFAAADTAQTILDNINFNGIPWNNSGFDTTRLAQISSNMNYLAKVLDSYNNGTLVITELKLPYPGIVGP